VDKPTNVRAHDAGLVPLIERLIKDGRRDEAQVQITYLLSAVKRKFYYAKIYEMPAPQEKP
jgi:hypothetical protein